MTHTKHATFSLLGLILLSGLALTFSLPQQLGAHPWWSDKVLWIGVPVGAILALLTWAFSLGRLPRVLGFSVFTVLSYSAAHIGKSRFAASYAEDMFAGQMWYFGWIATCAFCAATLASIFLPRRQKH
jgi:hypothetical protein